MEPLEVLSDVAFEGQNSAALLCHVSACRSIYNCQTGCSFDGNSEILKANVLILIDSLLTATCTLQGHKRYGSFTFKWALKR